MKKNSPVKVTFNLTPTLIQQIDDFVNNGAKGLYWVMAEKNASSLSDDDKRFIIIDIAWPADATTTQEELLSKYPASTQPVTGLKPDDFPQLMMFVKAK